MLIQLLNGVPTGYPVTESNFRKLYPGTSFPSALTPASVQGTDFGLYEYTTPPAVDRYEKAVEVTPTADPTGIWKQTWQVTSLTPDESAEVDSKQASSIRNDRNKRLAECDWTQLPDAPVDAAAWATYRQTLRDISSQAGFPWDVQWPKEPS